LNKKDKKNPNNEVSLNDMANAIRFLAADAVEKANCGHPGMPMGAADFTTVLYSKFLKIDPQKPDWPDRDRVILSAGHGSMLLYAVNHLVGFSDMTIEEIKNFRQLGSKTPGHPEYGHTLGVETTTGPLGQGISTAVGMAIAEKIQNAKYGDAIVDHKTYVIASDGDLMEGISQEAISLAGHLKLSKLIVLFDDNNISIDGAIDLSDSTDQLMRFEASGWNVNRVDGHNHDDIEKAIQEAIESNKPSLIACKTKIGFGSPSKEGKSSSHGAPLGAEDIAQMKKNLNWDYEEFEIPSDIKDAWRLVGLKNSSKRQEWEERLLDNKDKEIEFLKDIDGQISEELDKEINEIKKVFSEEKPGWATRKSSQEVLETINKVLPNTIGGSADLTGSNNTKTKNISIIDSNNFAGRFIHYGIREHGMAAAMNGIALHKGLIPYSGTFLVFSDYCRPSIRLAALMDIKVIHVMTHDSIGLGEDGPTHQPVEHLPSLRAIPNLNVFRPADTTETAECWSLAIKSKGPSIIALSRQGCPHLRNTFEEKNKSSLGAYEIKSSDGEAQVNLIATGSEVSLAVEVHEELKNDGINSRVVSAPSFELLNKQDNDYIDKTLGQSGLRVGIEASTGLGWHNYLGDQGLFIGMSSFGASAPADQLYKNFGIDKENIINKIKEKL
jgi:transketolase